MATRARILADYVSGGATAAEFDYLDGVTSNIQTQFTAKAPLASPAFTGTPTGITAAHITSGVLPVGVTGGSGLDAVSAGKVLQVVQTVKTDVWTTTASGDSPTLVTGLSRTITPSSTSNKILVQASVYAGASAYSQYIWIRHNGSGSYANLSNGSDASVGDTSSATCPVMFGGQGGTAEADEASTATMTFLDSPSKDSLFTYQVYACGRAAGTLFINKPANTTDAVHMSRGISTLTLWEIAQ